MIAAAAAATRKILDERQQRIFTTVRVCQDAVVRH
jgi:hypothetical protein